MSAYFPWLMLYVLVNVISAFAMADTGELVGDVAGQPLSSQSALFWATILVISSYVIILGPAFKFISRIKINAAKFHGEPALIGERIGKLLLSLQAGYAAFNLLTGVNVAGSHNTTTDSYFSLFWVLFPVDALFFIYYGLYRENKYFYPNVIIYLGSNLLRGWAGVFLFVMFFEWCRAFRNRKIKPGKTIFWAAISLVLYPILTNLKWVIRASAGANISIADLIGKTASNFDGLDYISLVGDGIAQIAYRLQVTSMVVEVMRLSDALRADFAKHVFTPFWMEGLHGIFFDRLLLGHKVAPIGVAFTQYINTSWQFEIGDWNANIGYVGWFFITPYLIPLYIAYTLFLGFLSFYFIKKIGMSESARDMLWLAWLVYLMPPWLSVFVNFIYALLVFFIIKIFLSQLGGRRFVLSKPEAA